MGYAIDSERGYGIDSERGYDIDSEMRYVRDMIGNMSLMVCSRCDHDVTPGEHACSTYPLEVRSYHDHMHKNQDECKNGQCEMYEVPGPAWIVAPFPEVSDHSPLIDPGQAKSDHRIQGDMTEIVVETILPCHENPVLE